VSIGSYIEESGPVSVGGVRMTVRVGDAVQQMQRIGSRLRAEIRNTMEYLGRTTRTEMAARAPHRGGGLDLPRHIAIGMKENDKGIRVWVRPLGSERVKLAAYVLEGGMSGPVEEYWRRPAGSRARNQAVRGTRARFARKGGKLIRVGAYSRTQAAQPFVRPVYETMRVMAEEALRNAAERAARGT